MADAASFITEVQRSQIGVAIRPWRTTSYKPPFTAEQLVTIALLLRTRALRVRDIFNFVNATFSYYARQVSEAFCERNQRVAEVEDFQRELQVVLQSYEFPSYIGFSMRYTQQWSISTIEGLELIRPLLANDGSESRKTFDLFALPAELRNRVYDMVFQYPMDRGLKFNTRGGVGRQPADRFDIVDDTAKSSDHEPIKLNTRPMGRILAPLLTCRQFYNEAMPTFYRTNRFRVDNLEDLLKFLDKLGPKRRKHLSHLSIAYPRRDRTVAAEAFRVLSRIEHLRTINLRVEEATWLKWVRAQAERQAIKNGKDPITAREKYQSALDMPGMHRLLSIRGLEEVNVAGIRKEAVLPLTIETLKRELTRDKDAGAVKKRKYREDEAQLSKGARIKRSKMTAISKWLGSIKPEGSTPTVIV